MGERFNGERGIVKGGRALSVLHSVVHADDYDARVAERDAALARAEQAEAEVERLAKESVRLRGRVVRLRGATAALRSALLSGESYSGALRSHVEDALADATTEARDRDTEARDGLDADVQQGLRDIEDGALHSFEEAFGEPQVARDRDTEKEEG